MLKEVHIPHMGIEKTRLRVRESMFWPGVNREIKDMIKLCNICMKNQRKPMIASDLAVYLISDSSNRSISIECSEFPISWTIIANIGKLNDCMVQHQYQ